MGAIFIMTDDEINARVAVIEGWHRDDALDVWYSPRNNPHITPWNYADDWLAVGPLIEKYTIELVTDEDEWVSLYPAKYQWRRAQNATTPQRAICLAVIAIAGEGG